MSLFYIIVEFSCGQLPWRRLTDKEAVRRVKQDVDHTSMLHHLPGPHFKEFFHELEKLDYFTDPDYSLLRSKLLECMEYNGVCDNDPYDWESSANCVSNSASQVTAEKATANMSGYIF